MFKSTRINVCRNNLNRNDFSRHQWKCSMVEICCKAIDLTVISMNIFRVFSHYWLWFENVFFVHKWSTTNTKWNMKRHPNYQTFFLTNKPCGGQYSAGSGGQFSNLIGHRGGSSSGCCVIPWPTIGSSPDMSMICPPILGGQLLVS